MLVHPIRNNYNQSFGINYALSKETIRTVERTTGLSYSEMENLTIDECKELMKKRGKLKETSRFKQWLADKYKKFGEKTGLLEKQHAIYSDVD